MSIPSLSDIDPGHAGRLSLSVGVVAIVLVAATTAAAWLAAIAPGLYLERVFNAAYAIAAVGGSLLGLIGTIAAVLALAAGFMPSDGPRGRLPALLGLVLNLLSLIVFVQPVAALAFDAALALLNR
jgi:hypothetical protein